MKKYKIMWMLSAVFITGLFITAAYAGEATDRIKAGTDKLIEILTDKSLDPPEMSEKRARMIRETVDSVFDWAAFSQRALGRHWKKLSEKQKKEFIYLFGQLLERTYMDKTRLYSGEQMNYLSEEMDGKYCVVNAEINTGRVADIEVQFRLIKDKGREWFVYDVYIEGVSLVNNYRSQFNNILTRSGYSELIGKLKAKLEE